MLGKNDILEFGKYKGKTIDYIWGNDPSYIVWVDKNISEVSIDQFIVANCQSMIDDEDGPDIGDLNF